MTGDEHREWRWVNKGDTRGRVNDFKERGAKRKKRVVEKVQCEDKKKGR